MAPQRRRADGRYPLTLQSSEAILSQIQEPHLYPELSKLRGAVLRWRFYHHFRTDAASPLRQPQVGVRTPVLSADASDLARAPGLLGLNEPETSLHPSLISPLAKLIVRASENTQLWVTTHSQALAAQIEQQTKTAPLRLRLDEDGTKLDRDGDSA